MEDLNAKVFNNPIIVSKLLTPIFEFGHSKLNTEYRKINKTFNNVCLDLIRKNHRSIEIEFNEKSNGRHGLLNTIVHVFNRWTHMSDIPAYFNFLYNVVNLEIEELRIKDIWKLKPRNAEEFHDNIHSKLIGNRRAHIKTLVGLEEVCQGCSDCLKIAESCQEYGPIGMEALQKFSRNLHFQRLIVTDRLLEQIANHCASSANDIYQNLKVIINPQISCDTLVLWISESRRIGKTGVPRHQSMPREVLEKMAEIWRVKSINIKFINGFRRDICDVQWEHSFTPFKFTDSFDMVEKSKKLYSHVEVNLRDSLLCRSDLRSSEFGYGFENLIANIQRMFPTSRIDIKEFSVINDPITFTHATFDNLIRIINIERKQEKLIVNVDFFIRLSNWNMFYTSNNEMGSYEIPNAFSINESISRRQRKPSINNKNGEITFGMLEYVGRRLTIKDKNLEINLFTFINKCVFRQDFNGDHSGSFIRHFVPLT